MSYYFVLLCLMTVIFQEWFAFCVGWPWNM